MRVPLYILAGGKSSRFGSDKARALLHGTPLISHIVAALAPVSSALTVVADKQDKYADLGLSTVADLQAHKGPLGGLLTALRHNPSDWLLLVSCDFAAARAEWGGALLKQVDASSAAVAFKGAHWEPLFALYRRSLVPQVEQRLARDELAMWKLLDACGAKAVALPADWPRVPQINSPSDLEAFELKNER